VGDTADVLSARAARAQAVKDAEASERLREETWRVEGVTFSAGEFGHLKHACTALARTRPLDVHAVGGVLLEARRLLTPHQARELYTILRPAVLNPSELEETSEGRAWVQRGQPSLLVVLVGFLVDAKRWVDTPYEERQRFWDDENSACFWANSSIPGQDTGSYCEEHQRAQRRRLDSYEVVLRASIRARRTSAIDPEQCDWWRMYGQCWLDYLRTRPGQR